jgi:hypothetical protein
MDTFARTVEGRVFANITSERILARTVEAHVFVNMAYPSMFASHVTVKASAPTAHRKISARSVIRRKSKIHQFWNSPEGLARIAEKSAAEQESLVRLRANLAASLARANW